MQDDEIDRAELGPIATNLLFEDDRVRVWDQVIEPGASTGPHRHELPYALVTVEGTTLGVNPVPGYPDVHGSEPLSVPLESQTAIVIPAGAVEDAVNASERAYHAILVEFKNG